MFLNNEIYRLMSKVLNEKIYHLFLYNNGSIKYELVSKHFTFDKQADHLIFIVYYLIYAAFLEYNSKSLVKGLNPLNINLTYDLDTYFKFFNKEDLLSLLKHKIFFLVILELIKINIKIYTNVKVIFIKDLLKSIK